MAEVLERKQCPQCKSVGRDTSKDNLVVSTNGSRCYSCGYRDNQDSFNKPASPINLNFKPGLPKKMRGIEVDTAVKWGLGYTDKHVCFNYFDLNNDIVGQKLKTEQKKFVVLGKLSNLYGSWLFEPDTNDILVCVEGELDAISFNQILPNVPVVSVPNGAAGAASSLSKNLEYLTGFKKLVLLFDNDEPGQTAANNVRTKLSDQGVNVAVKKLPEGIKDVNELLTQERGDELEDIITRKSGIVCGSDIDEESLFKPYGQSILTGFDILDSNILGLPCGKATLLVGPPGRGKSTMSMQMCNSFVDKGLKVGYIALEHTKKELVDQLVMMRLKKSYTKYRHNQLSVSKDEYLSTWKNISNQIYICVPEKDRSTEFVTENIEDLLDIGVDVIVVDTLQNSFDATRTQNQFSLQDASISRLTSSVMDTNTALILIMQMNKDSLVSDKDGWHNVHLTSVKGSGSLVQQSKLVLGLESNDNNNKRRIRVIKNNQTGYVGVSSYLEFNNDTNTLNETSDEPTLDF